MDRILLSKKLNDRSSNIFDGFAHTVQEAGRKRFDSIKDNMHTEFHYHLDAVVHKNNNTCVFTLHLRDNRNNDIDDDFYFRFVLCTNSVSIKCLCNSIDSGIQFLQTVCCRAEKVRKEDFIFS